ncbi:MAG: DUF1850 domain-containing protein [Rhodospirillales bacterium]|nr:DUF1850 domain-containing protein [Rhodospirillales bacterium]
MPVCLAIAQTLIAFLPTNTFTLAWTHSAEKTSWREDWAVVAGQLMPTQAAIEGSGAGMDPPPGAELVDGEWRYTPTTPPMPRLVLANSSFTDDYEICWNNVCRMLATLNPRGVNGPLEIYPCDEGDRAASDGDLPAIHEEKSR